MARCQVYDLGRLDAVLANKKTMNLSTDVDWQTLVVLNPLAAPMYILYSGQEPSAAKYDLVVPGNALLAHPIPKIAQLTAANVYPGAVPGTDVGLAAILRIHEAVLAAFVGPLA